MQREMIARTFIAILVVDHPSCGRMPECNNVDLELMALGTEFHKVTYV